MNAVEIEEAVSALAERPFDRAEFPFAFLEAFGNKETTIKKLRAGATNKSDVGGVLQTNNIHIAVAEPGEVTKKLAALKASPTTTKAKAKFILATDGDTFEAEDLTSDETVACEYADFPNKFGFFLPLAGISTVRQVRESSFDIRATSRLNRLYVELLKDNPDWAAADRRHDMNHFMARLIFCFFAEDTDIFNPGLFTQKVEEMSARDSSNTHEVIATLFRAMNTKMEDREKANLPRWTVSFPYVNGGLFSGSLEVPRFSRIARSYLLHIGKLDWKQINPDIFGSMIQAVADDEERGALGMHYTSVPNILKVLNPLFLDDLREKLEEAGGNSRKLLNLRNRMSRVRVFDPACGSGNFLVIAYKEMRAIEAEINKRRGEPDRRSDIPLTNFRGIELRDFPAEIARLALIIAEYQCDVLYRGQKLALVEFLPLDAENWIICGNALRLDWLAICPPTGTGVKLHADDLLSTPLDQTQIDFENEGGETYICSNPPYVGRGKKTAEQLADMEAIFGPFGINHGHLDYVSCWLVKAASYGGHSRVSSAFVATNSICQGSQIPLLWPIIFSTGHEIFFAYTSFRWANLAAYNAGVTVVVVGIMRDPPRDRLLFIDEGEGLSRKTVENINAYLVAGRNAVVEKQDTPAAGLARMDLGSMPKDGGFLLLTPEERDALALDPKQDRQFVRRIYGSEEIIHSKERYCLWIDDDDAEEARSVPTIFERLKGVASYRLSSAAASTRAFADRSHRFIQVAGRATHHTVVVPRHSSEKRPYLPCGVVNEHCTVADSAFALYDAPLWNFAILVSQLHLVWIATVCGKLETRYRYSSVGGWNTFPVPELTDKNRDDLTQCAEDILLTREMHFPATLADLYDPDDMPTDLRRAHDRNDEVIERIYIGRRFKNDTERMEKLFELYMKRSGVGNKGKNGGKRKKSHE